MITICRCGHSDIKRWYYLDTTKAEHDWVTTTEGMRTCLGEGCECESFKPWHSHAIARKSLVVRNSNLHRMKKFGAMNLWT